MTSVSLYGDGALKATGNGSLSYGWNSRTDPAPSPVAPALTSGESSKYSSLL